MTPPKGRILVVDDEPFILNLLAMQLERLSYSAQKAGSGQEALELLRKDPFDLLVADIMMPEMDGLTLMQQARTIQPNLECIIISGQGEISTAVEAMRLGAINYIQKPVSMLALDVSLAKGMERLTLLRDLRDNQLALQKSEAQLRALMHSSQVGIFLYRDEKIIFANPVLEAITGYRLEECLGMRRWAFIHPEHQELVRRYGDRTAGVDAQPARYEVKILTKAGEVRWLDFLLNTITLDGQQTGMVSLIDISERKRIEQELSRHQKDLEQLVADRTAELARTNRQLQEDIKARKKAEKEAEQRRQQLIEADKMVSLGILVAGVAHEINNPNNFITMNAPILRRAWEDFLPILEEQYRREGDFPVAGIPFSEMREHIPELFSGILDGSERIRKIVLNLRDYARQGISDMEQNVALNDVVRAALVLLASPLKKATHHLTVAYGENLPPIKGNFQRAEQVIINLIQNACQALSGPEKGITISTGCEEENEWIFVEVTDQGCGISAKHLKSIQDPFFTTKRDNGGSGLGLSISAGIMEEHGGRLEFFSQPEAGTTARALFPRAAAPEKKAREHPASRTV